MQYGHARKPVGTLLPQRAQYDVDCFGSVRVQSTSARHEGHRNADEAICAPQLGQITAYLSFLNQSLYIHTTLLSSSIKQEENKTNHAVISFLDDTLAKAKIVGIDAYFEARLSVSNVLVEVARFTRVKNPSSALCSTVALYNA